VQLPHKKQFLINYAGSNGRPYTSLGKVLVKNQDLTSQHSSMQDIRAWLLKHPEKMNSVLNKNASYVFFRVLKNKDPLGAEQVPLTSRRSLAVDKSYIPLGVPVWLDTGFPSKSSQELVSFRHLMIAQDTGGAIKGIVRGDVYWGSGDKATFIAGHMKSPGRYWLLLPRANLK
jgi:membrane-bound lytic murein transglycosylase A